MDNKGNKFIFSIENARNTVRSFIKYILNNYYQLEKIFD